MFETDFIASPTKQSAKSKSIHYRKPKAKDCAKAVMKSDGVGKITEQLLTVSPEESYSSAFPGRRWKK
jgi:hypothetical protein